MKKTTKNRPAQTATTWLVVLAGLLAIAALIFVVFVSSTPSEEASLPQTLPNITPTQDVSGDDIAPSSPIRIIALGDSLTAGYGLPLAESYPEQLERLLVNGGANVDVINAGISGETTAGTLSRVGFIRAQSPFLVILGIGGNDMLRFTSTAVTEKNLRAILSALTTPPSAPHVILLQMQATDNAGTATKEAFDALYPNLAAEFNVPLVPFVIPEVILNPELMLNDRVHPNQKGYEYLVTNHIAPAVSKVLQDNRSTSTNLSTKLQ